MIITSQINAVLRSKNMSIEQLIEKTNLQRMTIFNARRGKNVTIATAIKIAEALEVPVESIWLLEEETEKEEAA